LRHISNAKRTSETIASSTTKIEAENINILADELSFPFTGGSLGKLEDIIGVDDEVIVGVGLGITVAIGVGVGRGVRVGREVGAGVGR